MCSHSENNVWRLTDDIQPLLALSHSIVLTTCHCEKAFSFRYPLRFTHQFGLGELPLTCRHPSVPLLPQVLTLISTNLTVVYALTLRLRIKLRAAQENRTAKVCK